MAMPADVFEQHPRLWMLEEVLALPEDGQCIELIDRMLVMSPGPTPTHQRILQRLQVALLEAIPADLELLPGVNVVLDRRRLLIPDLVVTNVSGHTQLYFTGDQIVLATEILSPSSRAYDRVLKRKLYADARVPYYLVVDPAEPTPSASLLRLFREDYREMARSVNGLLDLEHPFPVGANLAGVAS